MRSKRRESVGIRELKDQASAIVERVRRSGSPVGITKNHKEVARIVPLTNEPVEELVAAGFFIEPAPASWSDLELEPLGTDAGAAMAAIASDRGA